MKIGSKSLELPFHVVKRAGLPLWKSLTYRVVAVLAALIICSLLSIFMANANPLEFVRTMFDGGFGTERRLWKFAKSTCVLLCIALAITPAFKMQFWNIGAEGQTLIGALASVMVIMYTKGLPEGILLLLMFLAAVVAGALWGGIPAFFKAKWGTNETLFTLMMNYIASGLVAYFLLLWTPDGSSVLGRLDVGHLPIIGHEYLLVIISAVVLSILLYIYQRYTKQGYEISVVGESENTAKYIGINVKKVVIRTMIISGAICGFAGFLIVGALDHSVSVNSAGGMGFTAIMVSWLAKFNPVVMIGTSAFITFLEQGSAEISTVYNVDSAFPDIIIGIVLFFIIGCEFFVNYQLKLKSHDAKISTDTTPSVVKKNEEGGNGK